MFVNSANRAKTLSDVRARFWQRAGIGLLSQTNSRSDLTTTHFAQQAWPMKNSLPKIATVLLAISAVAFMGLSVSAYFGRPNPAAEMSEPILSDFKFESTIGETVSWTVTSNVGQNKNPKTVTNPYEAVLWAYKKKAERLTAETNEMNAHTQTMRDQVTQVRTDQQVDIAAIEKRISELKQYVVAADAQLFQQSQELQRLSVETMGVRVETGKRREDVTRLQSELVELRNNRFGLQENIRVLTDRLLRLQLANQDLELRLNLLNSQLEQ